MSLRGFILLAVVIGALGLAWVQRERLQAAWAAVPAVPVAAGGDTRPPAGALRKCVKGGEVTYTNVDCPAGFKAAAVGGTPVNVLPATPVARPASAASAPSSLHQALDLTRDDKLRDRIMDRAIEGATR